MKLYDGDAPNPRRLRIFLAEKKIEIPTERVDVRGGGAKTPEILATNPLGLVPILELDDGSCLTESVAICRYFEETQPEPPLFGRDARERAEVEMWNRRMELELFRTVGDYFRHTAPFFRGRFVQASTVGEEARRFATERLPMIDAALADRRYLAGDTFSIADITGWVAVDLGIPSVFELGPELPHLTRWFEDVSARPSTSA